MRTRISAALMAVVATALLIAGVIVYAVERTRVHHEVAANVDQEFAELDRLATGVNPRTQQRFTSAVEVIDTFFLRNVAGSSEVLVGWWDGQARRVTPSLNGVPLADVPLDLRADSPASRALAPLVEAGRSGRLDLEPLGEVSVSVQQVTADSGTASLVVLTFMNQAQAGLRDTIRTYLLVSSGALLLIGIGVWWLSGRLLRPLRDLRRSAEGVTARDLSHRIPERGNDDLTRLAATYNGMLDRLEESFTSQRQFLDDAGHELKTPLTVLSGHLELLDPHRPDEVEATRSLLLDEVDRMSRLVEDLTLLTKARRPDFLRPGPTDIGDLTRTVHSLARALTPDRSWLVDAVAETRIRADEQRLTQALLQLADNAVKHTDAGAEIAIGSSITRHEGRRAVALWVRDAGDGVPGADRLTIFERFGRSEVRPGDEGFGLGLSIVRAIATAHGGEVRVEDPAPPRPGGSMFVITLPSEEE